MDHLKFLLSICVASHLSIASAQSQNRTTLAEYLASTHLPGQVLALDAEDVSIKGKPKSLADFKRKLVTVGTLSAVVPTNMVVIDDTFKQPANMYDGLPMNVKVLYLLSTLSGSQWNKVTGAGIGLSDLNVDQKAVFNSILPNPFKWTQLTLNDQGDTATNTENTTLSDEDRQGVKLRVEKEIHFDVSDQSGRGRSTFHPWPHSGGPYETLYMRNDDADYNRSDTFGVQVKQSVPNKLKPSQLTYSEAIWNTTVPIKSSQTVKELLQKISTATGAEIHADLRVADLKVSCSGQSARAGDLLQSLAMAVTGTYRKVGTAYVLCSDLIGLGTRKLLHGIWGEEIQQEIWRKRSELLASLAATGKMSQVKFSANNPLAPTSALQSVLKANDSNSKDVKTPFTQLTPAMQTFVNSQLKMYRLQKFDGNNVVLGSDYRFGFTLPSGQRLNCESQGISSPRELQSLPKPPVDSSVPKGTPVVLTEVSKQNSIFIAASEVSQLTTLIPALTKKGIANIAVQTRSLSVLSKAVELGQQAGINVSLVIHPWASQNPSSSDIDRTLLGDRAEQLRTRIAKSTTWKTSTKQIPGEAEDLIEESITPSDPHLQSHINAIAELAAVPGISSIYVLNCVPKGYEGSRDRSVPNSRSFAQAQLFGYSVSQRLAFLREKGIDPIDIAWEMVNGYVDLRQPFFLDDAMRGGSSIYDGTDQPKPAMRTILQDWDTFLSNKNRAEVTSLLNRLSARVSTIYVEPASKTVNAGAMRSLELFPWKPGQNIPTSGEGFFSGPNGPANGSIAHLAIEYKNRTLDFNTRNMLKYFLANKQFPFALDLTTIPTDEIQKLIDELFTTK